MTTVQRNNFWDRASIFLSVLILVAGIWAANYRDSFLQRTIGNIALVEKIDIIHWAVQPLLSAGFSMTDNSILKQAYFLYLLNAGFTAPQAESRLNEVNTIEDFHAHVPVDIIDKINLTIGREYKLAHWFDQTYIFLAGLLVLCQFFALRSRREH